MLISVRWEPNERWLGGWEPVEILEGNQVPPDQDDQVWYCIKVIPGEHIQIINPSAIPINIRLTKICPAPGRN